MIAISGTHWHVVEECLLERGFTPDLLFPAMASRFFPVRHDTTSGTPCSTDPIRMEWVGPSLESEGSCRRHTYYVCGDCGGWRWVADEPHPYDSEEGVAYG